MKPSCLGIIPARGGSKGILRKNIRLLAGHPLIAYTIKTAQESKLITNYITSTDDPEIADIAHQLGSSLLIRPPELSADDTPMISVVQHAISHTPGSYEYIVLLQPTAPFRTGKDVDAAIDLLIQTGADSIISVYQVFDQHPARMYRMIDKKLVPYEIESPRRLRQELPPVYHRNGAIYACKTSFVMEHNTLIGGDLQAYIMPRERSINIDDEVDLEFADFMMRKPPNKSEG